MSCRHPAAHIHEIVRAPKALVAGQSLAQKRQPWPEKGPNARQGPTSGRSGEWKVNKDAHARLENRPMACHSRVILADRPEVGPCLRTYFRRLSGCGACGKVDGLVKIRFAMSTFAAPLIPDTVRHLPHASWQESLVIAEIRQGLWFALSHVRKEPR
jgi:hypothetical protein